MLVTRSRKPAENNQGNEHAVEKDAANQLDPMEGRVALVVLGSVAGVHDEAKCEEVAIGAESQVEVHAKNVRPQVLIKDQVDELESLEEKKKFDLCDTLLVSAIVDQAPDHELHHHHHLERDPDPLDDHRDSVFFVCCGDILL